MAHNNNKIPGLTCRKLKTKTITEFPRDLPTAHYKNYGDFPDHIQKIIFKLVRTKILPEYPTDLTISKIDLDTNKSAIRTDHYKWGKCVFFIVLGAAKMKLTKQTESIKLDLIPGNIIILTESARYDQRYKFTSDRMILLTFKKKIPTTTDIVATTNLTELQTATFVEYVSGLHPADSADFFVKLDLMSKKKRQKYLNELFDTELNEMVDNI